MQKRRASPDARDNSVCQEHNISEILFADDTTLCGTRAEIQQGRDCVVEILERFEEKCHPDKEEVMRIGHPFGGKIRILGSYSCSKEDTKRKREKMQRAAIIIRRRICKSALSKRTQARVLEACVESIGLFDAAITPWPKSEIRQIQQVVDRLYHHIWSDKKGPPLLEMKEKETNMFGVRKSLQVDSLQLKIEKRTLERIGHVLRMDRDRMTKITTLGWPKATPEKPAERTTITYWRTTLRNAGLDPDLIDKKCLDRKEFKKTTRKRIEHIRKWEHEKADREDGTTRNQRETRSKPGSVLCSICTKECKNTLGLKVHHKRMHRDNPEEFRTCSKCNASIKSLSALRNHQKRCAGSPPGICPYCRQANTTSNIARHRKVCPQRSKNPPGPY